MVCSIQTLQDQTTIALKAKNKNKVQIKVRNNSNVNIRCKVGELKDWQRVFSVPQQKADLIVSSNISDWCLNKLDDIFGTLQNTLSSNGILLTRTMDGDIEDLLKWAEKASLCSVKLQGVDYSNLYTVHTFVHKSFAQTLSR